MIGVWKMGAKLNKAELREILKKERSGLTIAERQEWDQKILNKFWQNPVYLKARKLMVYLAFGDEINTWPILDQAWADGKRVFVPKVQKYPKEIIAVEINDRSDLKPSLWGIHEPISNERTAPDQLDLVVVPGLAFNKQGYRLGYGGGYYDRFLPQTFAYKVGFCYTKFVREIPVAPWDQPVDLVLTEA